MSHELRTPLTGLLGSLRLLQSTELEGKQHKYVAQGLAAGNSMLELVNNILDFSKSQAAVPDVHIEPFAIRELLMNIAAIFSAEAECKGIDLRTKCNENVAEIVAGDRGKLLQILLNLVGNAVKFTHDGFVELEIKHTRTSHRWEIIVSDSGIGIDAKLQQAVFDPFFQINDTDSRLYGGTGLGLAIVKNLVTCLDGELTVQSNPKGGTVFRLLVNMEVQPVKVTTEKDVRMGMTLSKEDKLILVVEDDPTSNAVIVDMVEACQYRVASVFSGLEALSYLDSNEPDLILMDCQMPRLSGFETAAEIRNHGNHEIPIVGMSASISRGEKQRALNAGMTDFLEKPLTVEGLSQKIAEYIGQAVKGSVAVDQASIKDLIAIAQHPETLQ